MFVDASAWTAILLSENEVDAFEGKLLASDRVLMSAIANWETVRAIARVSGRSLPHVQVILGDYQSRLGTEVALLGKAEEDLALQAHARFGKGVHPAKLNMGDCFAYACARTHGVPLLFKGYDFSLTDIESA